MIEVKRVIKTIFTLENFIMILSLAAFVVSCVVSVTKKEVEVSNMCLSFISTVLISWIMTKKSSRSDFEKDQEKLAKLSHRHLGDVEKTALRLEQSIKDQIHMYYKYDDFSPTEAIAFLKMLDSRIDDLKDRIKSTNRDWFDLLSKEEQDRIESKINPEDKNETDIDDRFDFGILDEFVDFDDSDFDIFEDVDFDDTDAV